MNNISDEKTLDIVQEKTGSKDKFKNKLTHFLVDFNVLSYLVSFLIALQFKDFLHDLIDKMLSYVIDEKKYQLLTNFISLVIICILCFVFIYSIFYKYLYTEDVEKEAILKSALTEKKKELAKKEVEKKSDTKKEIEDTAIIEEFNSQGLSWI